MTEKNATVATTISVNSSQAMYNSMTNITMTKNIKEGVNSSQAMYNIRFAVIVFLVSILVLCQFLLGNVQPTNAEFIYTIVDCVSIPLRQCTTDKKEKDQLEKFDRVNSSQAMYNS